MDNEAKVRIVGDASGVAPATDQAKGAVTGLRDSIAQLNATMKEMGQQMAASMQGVSKSVQETRNELKHLEEEEEAGFRAMVMNVHEGVESFNKFKATLAEIGEVYMAAFAVEQIVDWAKEMGEAAEKTEHLAQTFGMTVPQIQGLQGVAAQVGMSMDELAKGMGIFDKNMVQAAAGSGPAAQAFKAIGVSAKEGKDQMTLLLEVAEKFQHMEDGPRKVALAMQLFGKAGKDMIPFLNEGREGLERLDRANNEYSAGAMIATAANKELRDWLVEVNKRGVELAESTNESKVAWQGVSNVLTDSFAPMLKVAADGLNEMIKGFIESYREGGAVKIILDALTTTIEAVGTLFKQLGSTFFEVAGIIIQAVQDISKEFGGAFEEKIPKGMSTSTYYLNVFKDDLIVFKDLFVSVADVIAECVEYMITELGRLGKVINDVFTLNWGAISGDWDAGTARLDAIVEKHAKHIKELMADAMSADSDAKHGKDHTGGKPHEGVEEPKVPKDFDPGLPTSKSHQKKPKDDLVQKLDEELTAKKTAWAMEQEAQGTFQQFSLQSEADYWAQALKRTDLSAKDKLEIEKKWLAARQQLRRDEITIQLDGYKQELDQAGQNWTKKVQILEAEKAYIARMYGDQSKEARAAELEITKAKEQALKQREQLEAQYAKAVSQLKLLEVDAAQQAAEHEVAMGRKTKAELLQEEKKFESDRYAIRRAELEKEKSLIDPNRDPQKYQQTNIQLENLEKQHQNKLKQIDQQAALERTKIQRDAIGSVSKSWSQALAGMATGQMTFAQGIKAMWQGLVGAITQALANMIEQWLVKQLTSLIIGRTQQAVTGLAMVTSNAAVAGSGAYAATAAIPFIGPALAPAAAATAFAGAMSFAPLASAFGGQWEVPHDGQLTELHKNEMVLPAWAASPLRSMISGGYSTGVTGIGAPAANQNSPSPANDSGSGGDTHFHYHDHSGTMTPGQIHANRGAIAKAVKTAHREGHFAGFKLGGR